MTFIQKDLPTNNALVFWTSLALIQILWYSNEDELTLNYIIL